MNVNVCWLNIQNDNILHTAAIVEKLFLFLFYFPLHGHPHFSSVSMRFLF